MEASIFKSQFQDIEQLSNNTVTADNAAITSVPAVAGGIGFDGDHVNYAMSDAFREGETANTLVKEALPMCCNPFLSRP
jgi:hypothetical protein